MGELMGGWLDGWMDRVWGIGYEEDKGCIRGDVTVVRPSPCTVRKWTARLAFPSLMSS